MATLSAHPTNQYCWPTLLHSTVGPPYYTQYCRPTLLHSTVGPPYYKVFKCIASYVYSNDPTSIFKMTKTYLNIKKSPVRALFLVGFYRHATFTGCKYDCLYQYARLCLFSPCRMVQFSFHVRVPHALHAHAVKATISFANIHRIKFFIRICHHQCQLCLDKLYILLILAICQVHFR